MDRNIAILLTPPGAAAIAVVRLKGPAAHGFLEAHFSKPIAPGRCVHGDLADGPRVIDDAVVVVCDERTIDLNLHGGPWVVQSALDLAQRSGFDVLRSSSFPLPDEAVDGCSSLQREVLAHLPLARTETGVRVLLQQEMAWTQLRQKANARAELEAILADRTLWHLLHPPTVAIVGAANVGKSTLANQLFAQERSITADIPGTTRDWVGEIANVQGLPVMLLDTPGIRSTDDSIELAAIQRSRGEIRKADLVVAVLDVTRPFEGEQAEVLREHRGALRVFNKSDRPSPWARSEGIRTIATTGEGVEELRKQIVRFFCGNSEIDTHRPRCWTERQRVIVERALTDPRAIDEL